MRHTLHTIAVLLATGLTVFPAAAQTMKPGLWEVTSKMGGDHGSKMAAAQEQMQKQLAAMPPEQRKQMEKMMAQQGMGMPGAAPGGGMSARVCISKEMAARNEAPPQQGDCKQESMQKSGNTTKFKFSCSKPPATGEGEVTLQSPEAYTMKLKTVTQAKGRPETMTMESQGKWIAADCGKLKPVK